MPGRPATGASPSKRRRIGCESGAQTSDQTEDDIQLMRRLKQTFDSSFSEADKVLNEVPDSGKQSKLWSKMQSMSCCFSQLLNHKLAVAVDADEAGTDSALVTKLEKELEGQSDKVDDLTKELMDQAKQMGGKDAEIQKQKALVQRSLAVIAQLSLRLIHNEREFRARDEERQQEDEGTSDVCYLEEVTPAADSQENVPLVTVIEKLRSSDIKLPAKKYLQSGLLSDDHKTDGEEDVDIETVEQNEDSVELIEVRERKPLLPPPIICDVRSKFEDFVLPYDVFVHMLTDYQSVEDIAS